MRRRPIQHRGRRPTVFWLRGLSVLVWLLAFIAAGLTGDGAWAQPKVGSPLQTIAAELPTTTAPDFASHALPAGCAVQAACPVVMALTDVQPDIWDQQSVKILRDSEIRSGRTTRPLPPPPKPFLQA